MKGVRPVLWIDATAGASGDMLLGALVDLGVPLAAIRRDLARLPLDGWSIRSRRVVRGALTAVKVDVVLKGGSDDLRHVADRPGPFHTHSHDRTRSFRKIRGILAKGGLTSAVRDRALAVFTRLFEAEARAHGLAVEEVHLHEAGADDAIVDIVGVCAGLERLRAGRIVVSPVTTGRGVVACAHGLYPVPGPATAWLLRGVPLSGSDAEGERLTPTGAALLTTIADDWGGLPAMRPEAVGHGAGSHEFPERPNVVRMILGTAEAGATAGPLPAGEEILAIECTLDDATPQHVAFAAERLFAAGAVEVFTSAVSMKKGRLGHLLTALARPESFDAVASALLRETTTLGLRFRRERRIELERKHESVKTPFGRVRVKVAFHEGREIHAWPEYEDCASLARKHAVGLLEIQQAALGAHRGPALRKPPARKRAR